MIRNNWQNGLLIEWILAGIILSCVFYTLWFLFTYQYLPPPYFYEPSDIHGDWFNTSYWAHNPAGAFDTWTTLYPPLSFVILQIFSVSECYPHVTGLDGSPGYMARGCDWIGHISIFAFWILSIVLMFKVLRKFHPERAIPRTICLGLGWPMLNGIERGNLALIALPVFMLAVLPIVKSAKLRWVFAAMAINLKVYMIAPFMAQLIVRRWRWVEGVLIATVIVYLLSYAILGAGSLFQIVKNLTAWGSEELTNPLDFWPATTYFGLSALLGDKNQIFPTVLLLGNQTVDLAALAIKLIQRFTQIIILAALIGTWLRPECVTRYRVYTLGLMFALITVEGGGYTPIFWTSLILLEKWEGFGAKFALASCYILGTTYDITIVQVHQRYGESYIFGTLVPIDLDVTLWPLIRPLFIQLIVIALSCSTIAAVWRDVRNQGWGDRWIYRDDVPFLPWVRRPSPKSPE